MLSLCTADHVDVFLTLEILCVAILLSECVGETENEMERQREKTRRETERESAEHTW